MGVQPGVGGFNRVPGWVLEPSTVPAGHPKLCMVGEGSSWGAERKGLSSVQARAVTNHRSCSPLGCSSAGMLCVGWENVFV